MAALSSTTGRLSFTTFAAVVCLAALHLAPAAAYAVAPACPASACQTNTTVCENCVCTCKCTPRTICPIGGCKKANDTCGVVTFDNYCGNTAAQADCGACPTGLTCKENKCVVTDPAPTCASVGKCGHITIGTWRTGYITLDCPCPTGQTCNDKTGKCVSSGCTVTVKKGQTISGICSDSCPPGYLEFASKGKHIMVTGCSSTCSKSKCCISNFADGLCKCAKGNSLKTCTTGKTAGKQKEKCGCFPTKGPGASCKKVSLPEGLYLNGNGSGCAENLCHAASKAQKNPGWACCPTCA